MIPNIPFKQEIYSIAARPLTDEEVVRCVSEVEWEARIFFDSAENNGGPRNWPSYEAFLGFHIAKVLLTYQLNPTQLQTVVKMVYERAKVDDNNRRLQAVKRVVADLVRRTGKTEKQILEEMNAAPDLNEYLRRMARICPRIVGQTYNVVEQSATIKRMQVGHQITISSFETPDRVVFQGPGYHVYLTEEQIIQFLIPNFVP